MMVAQKDRKAMAEELARITSEATGMPVMQLVIEEGGMVNQVWDGDKFLEIEEPCPPQFAPGFDDDKKIEYLLASDFFWCAVQALTIDTGVGLEKVADCMREAIITIDVNPVAEIGIHAHIHDEPDKKKKVGAFWDIVFAGVNSAHYTKELHPYVKRFRRDYLRRTQ